MIVTGLIFSVFGIRCGGGRRNPTACHLAGLAARGVRHDLHLR
jgi:hypothetical protein